MRVDCAAMVRVAVAQLTAAGQVVVGQPQHILSRHLGIPEHRVRVINKDVGGSFGLKIHTYPDEIATCALAVMLGRPVKFLADRIESFQTDIHSRDHRVTAEVAVKRDGTIVAMRLDDLAPVGPFSMYPRSSVVECQPQKFPSAKFRVLSARHGQPEAPLLKRRPTTA